MPKIQDISRSKLIWGLKFLVFACGMAFLYWYTSKFSEVQIQLTKEFTTQDIVILIFILLGFSSLNWLAEIKKWQVLVVNISLNLAAKQSLISHGLSLLTPQKLGEFAGKCLFYDKSEHNKIIALTAIGQLTQLLSTLIFGVFGMIILFNQLNIFELLNFKWSWVMLIIPILYFVKPIRQKLDKIFEVLNSVEPSKIALALCWSVLRYVVFAHQFYLLLLCFDLEIPYLKAMAAISLVYLVASLLPLFSMADAFVKGSLAVAIFGLLSYNSPIILLTVFLIWVSNTMFPAMSGYLWMLSWKPKLLKAKS